MTTQTLPALAAVVDKAFPELNGRAFAVSEIQPFNDKTNVPTLPVCTVALMHEYAQQARTGSSSIRISSDVLIHFIFKPVKYTIADGSESPFYAFYDYEVIRDRLLEALHTWRSPRNAGLAYKTMDVSSDEFAVYVTFRFTLDEVWCNPDPPEQEAPTLTVSARTFIPNATCCEPCPQDQGESNAC